MTDDLPTIRLACEGDEHAHRAACILEAVGYTVVRDIAGLDTIADRARAIGEKFKLTTREQDVFDGVIRGRSNEQIARELDISRATVKWHMHNVLSKTNTGTREQMLRLALLGTAGETVDPDPAQDWPSKCY